ncbi:MAG: RNA polymerase sigma factor [Prevotella sp.]|nr:RNA polymerase sigma factor [Prevotella sp.]
MTQEEFTYRANEMRTKAMSLAGQFGYSQEDAEDIAQDAMLRLWSLHEQLRDAAHLKASTAITAKRLCIDRWRTTHQHLKIDDAMPIVDEDTLHDQQEYEELEKWLDEQIGSLPSTSGMVLRMRQLEHRELSEIADILGIRQTSVSTLLSRARNELLNKLKRRKQQ